MQNIEDALRSGICWFWKKPQIDFVTNLSLIQLDSFIINIIVPENLTVKTGPVTSDRRQCGELRKQDAFAFMSQHWVHGLDPRCCLVFTFISIQIHATDCDQ